ncbi:MAG: cbb3-type cytochrome c oxidase subunit I [Brumimicrobium sp.]|nr:cbb3-type cytochrome c oxidase subunit I [Brumimicrobium sp.]
MFQIDNTEKKQHRKLLTIWIVILLVLFPALITLGLLMRLNQGEAIELMPNTFYSIMTLHGLGMAGLLFSFAWAALCYLVGTRYAKLNIKFLYFILVMIVVGVVLLAYATLIGGFAAGWYALYPLPFVGTSWPAWSTGMTIVALIILGVAWLLGAFHIVFALAKEYGGFFKLMAFRYYKKGEPEEKLPPIALISVVALIPGILSYIAGAAMLIMYLMQHLNAGLNFDPLLMKNLMFFFGHMLVNITLYCGLGWVYTLMPEFTGREWSLNKITVMAWHATFFFIIFAYFHHLYMDFGQPVFIQVFGQLASYLSAIPASAVSIFGFISQLYRSKVKWTFVPTAFFFGAAGWAIGGLSAVVDSTIALNKVLHNTLWVPAHFHTYMLMGVVLFILGFVFYFIYEKNGKVADTKLGFGFWTFVVGACGFLLMFYMGGMHSVPRRYAEYSHTMPTTHEHGMNYAFTAAIFVILVLIGLLTIFGSIVKGLLKKSEA